MAQEYAKYFDESSTAYSNCVKAYNELSDDYSKLLKKYNAIQEEHHILVREAIGYCKCGEPHKYTTVAEGVNAEPEHYIVRNNDHVTVDRPAGGDKNG